MNRVNNRTADFFVFGHFDQKTEIGLMRYIEHHIEYSFFQFLHCNKMFWNFVTKVLQTEHSVKER